MIEEACKAFTASMRSQTLAGVLAMDQRLLVYAQENVNRYHRRYP
jgi:hypothetical protein